MDSEALQHNYPACPISPRDMVHRLRMPLVIRSDNGPQFRSEFNFFCQAHGITHELSSPYNPESNGLAEAAVKNMKSLVLRCKATGENLSHALAAWRNMIRQDGTSPTQLFFGRRQRLGLPMLPELLHQSAIDPSSCDSLHKERIADRDLHTVSLHDFRVGDRVWMQHHATKKWYKTAIVSEVRHGGQAYLVKVDSGQQYMCGRRFLRLDDRTTSSHSCRAVKFRELSPFPNFDASENAQSDLSILSPLLLPHSTLKCVPDTSSTDTSHLSYSSTHSTMQSPSDAPSSPVSQSRLCPRGRRSTYLVTPVPTLVCEVPVDVVSVPHQYNHVCLLYTSPNPRDRQKSRMPSSA